MMSPVCPPPLFTFGTLMDADVLQIVSNMPLSTLAIRSASIADHVQQEVAGEGFPILLPASGQQAHGRLIDGLTAAAMQRILFFEGDEYTTESLTVEVDGIPHEALYFKDSGVYQTTGRSWIFTRWQASEKNDFLERTQRYMSLYGAMDAAEADSHW